MAEAGIGREIGVVSAISIASRSASKRVEEKEIPEFDDDKSSFEGFYRSMRSHDVILQVKENITNSAKMRFDFIAMLISASMIAVGGLATNSAVIVVASMLVSPLMGPVLAFTLGITLQDKYLMKLGFKNELISILICIIVGFTNGIVWINTLKDENLDRWPTDEMSSRGVPGGLISGLYIAAASGIGVGLSVLGDYFATVVGVAISGKIIMIIRCL